MSFKVKYKNAKKAIKQRRSGEWEPVYNPISPWFYVVVVIKRKLLLRH